MDILIAQLFKGIKPAVLAWYRDRTGIAQKLRRLDMLVIKIRSVVEVSEKVKIENEYLCKWQQIFKDAATQGGEVLRKLQYQADNSSSSSSGICTFFQRLISRRKDVENLSSTIEWLEQISAEVKVFLKTLKLEFSELATLRGKLKHGSDNEKKGMQRLDGKRHREEEMPSVIRRGRFGCPVSEDKILMKGTSIPQLLRTFETPKKGKVKFRGPNNSYLDTEPQKKMEDIGCLVLGDKMDCFDEELAGQLEKAQLESGNLGHLLSKTKVEEVAEVEALAARIQSAVGLVKQKGEDGSWFGQWIAKLREAAEEGSSVVSAIKSNNFSVYDDEIIDEVGVIVTHVRLRLESMLYDLEDFKNLAVAEKLARELTPGPSNAHKK